MSRDLKTPPLLRGFLTALSILILIGACFSALLAVAHESSIDNSTDYHVEKALQSATPESLVDSLQQIILGMEEWGLTDTVEYKEISDLLDIANGLESKNVLDEETLLKINHIKLALQTVEIPEPNLCGSKKAVTPLYLLIFVAGLALSAILLSLSSLGEKDAYD